MLKRPVPALGSLCVCVSIQLGLSVQEKELQAPCPSWSSLGFNTWTWGTWLGYHGWVLVLPACQTSEARVLRFRPQLGQWDLLPCTLPLPCAMCASTDTHHIVIHWAMGTWSCVWALVRADRGQICWPERHTANHIVPHRQCSLQRLWAWGTCG